MASRGAALLRTFLFTLFVPGTVAVAAPWLAVVRLGHGQLPPRGWAWIGLVPMLAGAALYLRCAWGFASEGRGTPAPIDPTEELVAGGPYLWVRNPMYIAVVTFVAGEAVLFRSYSLGLYAALLLAVFHLFVRLYEEPTLRRQFGAPYERYLDDVARWWPRRPRRR
ncbi:MAG TPA: isoprenylcysteine carboxylmethyltransferase family protein [Thermoanaerobaculia bacterium]|nr:isoprenylcysteine carboxylmethyltransferase family protein [Thermoanaerobaculia bacterium]